MHRALAPYGDEIWALLRVVVGFLFACHGAQKLFGVLGGASGAGGVVYKQHGGGKPPRDPRVRSADPAM